MERVDHFYTVEGVSEGLYKEKGSKFIAYAYPVKNEEEVKETLLELKKQYYDARHHCYAYMLGAERKDYRANDDGEPNHSAGDPILGQINSKNLTNVLVVVVRYFGGTKLGVSGLINAYKVSAEEALSKAKVIKIDVTKSIHLEYTYEDTNDVMKLVSDFNIDITDQKFEAACAMQGEVNINLVHQLQEKVQLLQDLSKNVKFTID